MKLTLSPKDNINKIVLENVETYCIEGDTLLVVFTDGRARNYPMVHLWYWEGEVPSGNARSKPNAKVNVQVTDLDWNKIKLGKDTAAGSPRYNPPYGIYNINLGEYSNEACVFPATTYNGMNNIAGSYYQGTPDQGYIKSQ